MFEESHFHRPEQLQGSGHKRKMPDLRAANSGGVRLGIEIGFLNEVELALPILDGSTCPFPEIIIICDLWERKL